MAQLEKKRRVNQTSNQVVKCLLTGTAADVMRLVLQLLTIQDLEHVEQTSTGLWLLVDQFKDILQTVIFDWHWTFVLKSQIRQLKRRFGVQLHHVVHFRLDGILDESVIELVNEVATSRKLRTFCIMNRDNFDDPRDRPKSWQGQLPSTTWDLLRTGGQFPPNLTFLTVREFPDQKTMDVLVPQLVDLVLTRPFNHHHDEAPPTLTCPAPNLRTLAHCYKTVDTYWKNVSVYAPNLRVVRLDTMRMWDDVTGFAVDHFVNWLQSCTSLVELSIRNMEFNRLFYYNVVIDLDIVGSQHVDLYQAWRSLVNRAFVTVSDEMGEEILSNLDKHYRSRLAEVATSDLDHELIRRVDAEAMNPADLKHMIQEIFLYRRIWRALLQRAESSLEVLAFTIPGSHRGGAIFSEPTESKYSLSALFRPTSKLRSVYLDSHWTDQDVLRALQHSKTIRYIGYKRASAISDKAHVDKADDLKQVQSVLSRLIVDPTQYGLAALDVDCKSLEWFSTIGSTALSLDVARLELCLPTWTRLRALLLTMPLDYEWGGNTKQAPWKKELFETVSTLRQLEFVGIAGHGVCPRSFFTRLAANCPRLRLLKVWLYRYRDGPVSSCETSVEDLQDLLHACPELRLLDLAPPTRAPEHTIDKQRRMYLVRKLGDNWDLAYQNTTAVSVSLDLQDAERLWSTLPITRLVTVRVAETIVSWPAFSRVIDPRELTSDWDRFSHFF